jgi:ubiquinone biosynthesis protein
MVAAAANAVQSAGVPYRELPRLAAIVRIAVTKGWQRYVQQLGFGRLTLGEQATEAGASDAERLRAALQELGPTFVKFGQMLATRSDLFPESFVSELAKLRSDVPPFPGEIAGAIVERELGAPIAELFATFAETPFAAASIAQVHRATLAGGRDVVVKVQRPDIEETVASDLALLRYAARLLDRNVAQLRQYSLPAIVEEFADMITQELDFAREAANAECFAEANTEGPSVWVPAVVWPLSSRRVLTMEYSTGRMIDVEYPADRAARQRLAADLMQLFLTNVFEHGMFHADPHAGNVFVLDDGRLCFHDFGALGRLNARDQENLRQLFLAVIARDSAWLADTYLAMGGVEAGVDRVAFARDIARALERYYAVGGPGHSFSAILSEFGRLGREHRIRLVRESALVAKAYMAVESLARELDPEFDGIEAFRRYSGRLVTTLLRPALDDAAVARSYRLLSAARDSFVELPIAVRHVLEQVGGGGLAVRIRHDALGGLDREIARAANRIAFGMIVSAVVIGASIVLTVHAGPHIEGVPLLGIAGFALAGALGLGWAVAVMRSKKL